jgi:hypothetical protein
MLSAAGMMPVIIYNTAQHRPMQLIICWQHTGIFQTVFTDEKLANGLDGKNGMADVLMKQNGDWIGY